MNRVFLTAIFLIIFTSFMNLNAQWARTYGGSSADVASAIQQTSDGGYIVAGYTRSFSAVENDFWVLKLFPSGEIEWEKTYGGGERDEANSVQQAMDEGYIVAGITYSYGTGESDFWILKLFPDGDVEWQKTYGGDKSDSASFIQQTIDGGYIVAGITYSYGTGESDFWILKLSPGGDVEWQKTYGGIDGDEANSVQQTIDGGYIVAGHIYSFGAGDNDILVLKLFPNGDVEWQKTYGGGDGYYAYSIQQTSDGGYIVAGRTNVLKLSSEGDIEWQKTYRAVGWNKANSVQQTMDGGYIVAGETYSYNTEESDFWILKLFPNGDVEWQKTYGGTYSNDYALSLQLTRNEGYIVAGRTSSWGAVVDIWVLNILPNGDINPGCAFIRSSNAGVSDTDIVPEDTNITPEDTNITPEDTNISPQDSNANVYELCESAISTLTLSSFSFFSSSSSGGITDPAPGTYTYNTGTKVTIKAIPNKGYRFQYWQGNIFSYENPVTITMDGNKSIKARFYIPSEGDLFIDLNPCFIATAAYGSLLHPYAKILREFRDRYLMPSKLGRKIVDIYYKCSPFAANFIAKHKVLRIAVRINLLPIVAFSYSAVRYGPIITAVLLIIIFMLPVFIIYFFRRKLSRLEAKDPKALASR